MPSEMLSFRMVLQEFQEHPAQMLMHHLQDQHKTQTAKPVSNQRMAHPDHKGHQDRYIFQFYLLSLNRDAQINHFSQDQEDRLAKTGSAEVKVSSKYLTSAIDFKLKHILLFYRSPRTTWAK